MRTSQIAHQTTPQSINNTNQSGHLETIITDLRQSKQLDRNGLVKGSVEMFEKLYNGGNLSKIIDIHGAASVPEPFNWHVFHQLAHPLTLLHHGRNCHSRQEPYRFHTNAAYSLYPALLRKQSLCLCPHLYVKFDIRNHLRGYRPLKMKRQPRYIYIQWMREEEISRKLHARHMRSFPYPVWHMNHWGGGEVQDTYSRFAMETLTTGKLFKKSWRSWADRVGALETINRDLIRRIQQIEDRRAAAAPTQLFLRGVFLLGTAVILPGWFRFPLGVWMVWFTVWLVFLTIGKIGAESITFDVNEAAEYPRNF